MKNENLAAEIGQMIHNPTEQLHPDTVHETFVVGGGKERTTPVKEEPRKAVREEKALDAQREPVKTSPTQLERLKSCGKNALIYGILCLLVFYWQQTGQMMPSAAVPCMMACCGGVMWHVGRACR